MNKAYPTVAHIAQNLIRFSTITPQDKDIFSYISGLLPNFSCEIQKKGQVSNFFATQGTGPFLLFSGHVDVVPIQEESQWCHPPFDGVIDNTGILWGRGAVDMKGAIAAFLSAVHHLSPWNHVSGKIGLLLTSDEEGPACHGTKIMVPWLEKHNHTPDVILVGEPTGSYVGQEIKQGRRGSITATLTVQGQSGHIAYPENVQDPVHPTIDLLHTLIHKVWDKGTSYFPASRLQVTSIDVGNTTTNITADSVTVRWGIRMNTCHDSRDICLILQEICQDILKNLSYTLEFSLHGNAYFTPEGLWMNCVSQSVAEVCDGVSPKATTTGGATDGRFLTALAPVIECGLPETTMHQKNEHVYVKDLKKLERIYIKILKNYFNIH